MKLHYRKFGKGKPLIIMHGLYGSGDNWMSIARKLQDKFTIFLPDQRNHGDSPHDDKLDYRSMAKDIYELITSENIETPYLLGHSMGGKAAMQTAIDYPNLISKLVVLDISMRTYKKEEVAIHSLIVSTLKKLDIKKAKSRGHLDSQLSEYFENDQLRQFLLKNIKREESGRFVWKLNLDALGNNLDNLMKGVQMSDKIFVPTCLIYGKKSDYVKDPDISMFKEWFSNIRFIPLDTGHWIHVEKPGDLLETIENFLQ